MKKTKSFLCMILPLVCIFVLTTCITPYTYAEESDLLVLEETKNLSSLDSSEQAKKITINQEKIMQSHELSASSDLPVEFQDCNLSSLSLSDDNVLSGYLTVDILTNEEFGDNMLILAIYCNNKLISTEIGTLSYDTSGQRILFDDINVSLPQSNYTVNFFCWDKETFSPLAEPYSCEVLNSYEIYCDLAESNSDLPIYVKNNEVLAPLDTICGLGAVWEYDNETGLIYVHKNNHYTVTQLGYEWIVSEYKGEQSVFLPNAAAMISHSTLYIPLSTFCKTFGFKLFAEDENIINLFSNEKIQNEERCIGFQIIPEGKYTLYNGWVNSAEYYRRALYGTRIIDAFPTNDLFCYTGMESSNIYITDLESTVSLRASGIPFQLIIHGDYAYYIVAYGEYDDYLCKMDLYTGEETPLFKLGIDKTFYYMNGYIITSNGKTYNLADDEFTSGYVSFTTLTTTNEISYSAQNKLNNFINSLDGYTRKSELLCATENYILWGDYFNSTMLTVNGDYQKLIIQSYLQVLDSSGNYLGALDSFVQPRSVGDYYE